MVLPCGLKCDFRCANKGYVLLPWGAEERAFNKCRDIAELPPEFTPMINRKESLLGLKEGDGRNATLFAHLMAYKNRGATSAQIKTMAGVINDIIFAEPMDEKELDKIVENTEKYDDGVYDENDPTAMEREFHMSIRQGRYSRKQSGHCINKPCERSNDDSSEPRKPADDP